MNQARLSGLDNVLRLATAGAQRAPALDRETADRIGNSTFGLIHQVAEAVRSNEEQYEDAVKRATAQLKAAYERIEFLEERARHFEDRAFEAESWLARIRDEVQETLIVQRARATKGDTRSAA
jgi:hypothetical protein